MIIPWVDEFLVVTKYMNISRAARELALSQSALSRHLKQMEQTLGFKVFELQGGHIQLTPSGVELADGLLESLEPFQNLIDRCAEISRASFSSLTVQNPPYSDVVGEQYLSFLYNTINASGLIQYEFVTASRTAFIDRILDRSIDVAVLYVYDHDKSSALRELEERGLSFRYLASTPLGIWLPRDHEWAHEKSLSIDQLAQLTILFPNNSDHPLRRPYDDLMTCNGLKPKVKLVNNILDRFDFMSYQAAKGSFIFPMSMKDDYRMKWRSDIVCIPLDDSFVFSAYAITAKSSGLF